MGNQYESDWDRDGSGWMRIDRRESRRVELRHRDAFVLGPRFGTSVVTDLSASGMGLLLGSDKVAELTEGVVEIALGTFGTMRGSVLPVRTSTTDAGQIKVGFVLRDLGEPDMDALNSFLLEETREQEEVFDRYWNASDAVVSRQRDHILRVLNLSAQPGAQPLLVFDAAGRVCSRLQVDHVTDTDFTARADAGHALQSGRRYGLVAPGSGAASAFRAGLRSAEGNSLHFALPNELVQSGFRASSRCRDASINMSFAHPRSTRRVRRAVLDVSVSGLSMPFYRATDLLFPGDQLPDVRLSIPGRTITARGLVRSINDAPPDREPSCGIELVEFASTEDQDAWESFIFELLHPRLVHDRSEAARLGWKVLESSGYVDLWAQQADGAPLEDYLQYWNGDRASGEAVITLRESNEPVASLAINTLWPRTWMGHHLGVDARVRQNRSAFLSCTRELFSGMLHEMQQAPDLEYFAMYMEAGKGFNDFLYGDFARLYAQPDKLMWDRNHVYRANVQQPIPGSPMDKLVRVATAEDRALLAETYARTCSPLELDAMELRAHALGREGFARLFAPRQDRSRETYVFAPCGRPIWALVCETGSESANLFGLLNRCWLTPLTDGDSRQDAAARRTLLRRALRHYAQAGKHHCLLLEPEVHQAEDPQAVGFEHESEGVVWLSRREVLPAWLAYVADALSLSRAQLRRAA